jgi:hypothetical protein
MTTEQIQFFTFGIQFMTILLQVAILAALILVVRKK